ncbi:amidohydrolase family protein [Paraburkholderia sp.]|uniref:metal-dependent hydrolase family protein n=1 Tax=Paraburkholderia sp. TaxID=1926495 RepID=UPI0039E702D1
MGNAIVMRNFRLLDPRRSTLLDGLELLIEDGVIASVGERVGQPDPALVVDAAGLTVMPGLIDAHVHIYMNERNIAALRDVPQTYMAAKATAVMRGMLARGFTTVRDVAGGDYGMRDAVNAGFVDAPRLFVGGRAVSQTGGHGDFRSKTWQDGSCGCCAGLDIFSRIADGVPDVVKAVREELRLGADHIKLMLSGGVASPNDPLESLQFRDDEIAAAVDEANRWGSYVAAHAYSDDAVRRAIELGVRTIEHGNFICAATARDMAAKHLYLVPTLIVYHVNRTLGKESGKSASSLAKNEKVYEAGLEALRRCVEAGVKIGFGTDLSMHTQHFQCDGLRLHAKAQSNADVIRSATIVNAEIVRQAGRLGELIPGAHADLLVVDGNPLEDLSLFDAEGTRLRAIMKAGCFFRNTL